MKEGHGRPAANEYGAYFGRYIEVPAEGDLVRALAEQETQTTAFLSGIKESETKTLRGTSGWSLKQAVGHVCDTERVMCYRALRIARGDKTPLASFEQDDFVANARSDERTLESLIDEYKAVRRATLSLVETLSASELTRIGTASGKEISVRALLYVIAGHDGVHLEIMRKLYEAQKSASAKA